MAVKAGQVTVSTAGTAVQMTDRAGQLFEVRAHPSNAGLVFVGNDGASDVTSANGYPLAASGAGVVFALRNLNELWVDAATNGDKVCWRVIEE